MLMATPCGPRAARRDVAEIAVAAIPDGEPGSGNRRPSLVGGRTAVDAAGAALPAAAGDGAAAGESRRRMIEPVVIEPAVAGRCRSDRGAASAMPSGRLGGDDRSDAGLGELPSAICRVAASTLGRVAGFVLCRVAADECEVLSCAVDTGCRRRGTARRLLQAAFDEAVSAAADGKPSWKWRRTTPAALALYTGLRLPYRRPPAALL